MLELSQDISCREQEINELVWNTSLYILDITVMDNSSCFLVIRLSTARNDTEQS